MLFAGTARYVVLNPVRARMVYIAREWCWSGYHAMAGIAASPACLTSNRPVLIYISCIPVMVYIDWDGGCDRVLYLRLRKSGIVCGGAEVVLIGETLSGSPVQGNSSYRLAVVNSYC